MGGVITLPVVTMYPKTKWWDKQKEKHGGTCAGEDIHVEALLHASKYRANQKKTKKKDLSI